MCTYWLDYLPSTPCCDTQETPEQLFLLCPQKEAEARHLLGNCTTKTVSRVHKIVGVTTVHNYLHTGVAASELVKMTTTRYWITACTVVQAVVKATSQSNGKGQILTPWGSETPERISIKLGIYNRAAGMNTHANPCGAATTWVVWANTWKKHVLWFLRYTFLKNFLLYSSARAERAKVDRLWRSIRHTTCFHPRMCLLGVSFILLPIFGVKSPKNPNFGGVNRHFQA